MRACVNRWRQLCRTHTHIACKINEVINIETKYQQVLTAYALRRAMTDIGYHHNLRRYQVVEAWVTYRCKEL